MPQTGKAQWRLTLALAGLLASAASPAFAQTAQPPAAPQIGDRASDVIVVTGAATPVERQKIGASLTVLDGALIRDGGYDYVSDALRQTPGLAVSRPGGFGGLTQVRIRGAEGNHTLVLLDGVDVSPATDGETDLSTLLSANVQRIEILRGPQSGLYGSNAIGGVINVITRRDVDGRYYELSGEGGSFETYALTAAGGIGADARFIAAGAAYRDTQGFDISRGGPTDDREGDSNLTLYLRGGAALSPALRLDGFLRHVDKESGGDGFDFSGIPGLQGYAVDDATVTESEDFNAAGSATLSPIEDRWVTTVSGAYTDTRSDSATFGSAATRTKFALQSSLRFGGPEFLSTLTGFAEAKRETFRNLYPFTPDQIPQQSRDLTGVGAEYRAEIARQLYLSATVRHDGNEDFEDAETFGLAASWVIPDSGSRPHASLGTGVTNPSFFEQFGFTPGTFTGNPALVPEEAFGWDAGLEQTFADGRAVVDLTYFRADLDREIVACFPSVCNDTGRSEREGVELSLRLYPADGLDILGSWTWLDARDAGGDPEVRRPENMASFDIVKRFGGDRAHLALGVTYNGEMLDDDFRGGFTPVRTAIGDYTLVRLAGSLRLTDRVEAFGRIENVFNTPYEEALTYRTPGRAIYAGLRLSGGSSH